MCVGCQGMTEGRSGGPVVKWSLMRSKNSACTMNKFQNLPFLFI